MIKAIILPSSPVFTSRLADMGHSVVGVDVVETAIKQFFEEQSMSFSEEAVPAVPGAKVYKVSSGWMTLLFQFRLHLLWIPPTDSLTVSSGYNSNSVKGVGSGYSSLVKHLIANQGVGGTIKRLLWIKAK